jgi:hypothetical protein
MVKEPKIVKPFSRPFLLNVFTIINYNYFDVYELHVPICGLKFIWEF